MNLVRILLFYFNKLFDLQRIAQSLAKRALENGHDPHFYSPFARSAKRSLGINICGKNFQTRIRSCLSH
jgi:hypothetical protein